MPRLRRFGASHTPAELAGGDHACWLYEDEPRYVDAVVAFLDEGIRDGDRVWYVGDKPRQELLGDLVQLSDPDALVRRGQLRVGSVTDLARCPDAFDLGRALDGYRAGVAGAVAAGYHGLRVAVDVTPIAVGRSAADLCRDELAVDALISRSSLSILCGYDVGRLGPGVAAVEGVHPVQHTGRLPLGFSLHDDGDPARPGFRLTGEVDVDTCQDLRTALMSAAAVVPGPLCVDLTDLRFLDAAGARVVGQVALALQMTDRAVSVRGPRPVVRYCLETLDLGALVAT